MGDSKAEVLTGTLDMLILKTLALEPLHGYGIALRIEQMSQGVFRVNPGSLFPAFRRLERAGLTCNKNGIPFDPEKPTVTSGVRLGSPAGTTRGFGAAEFREIGRLPALRELVLTTNGSQLEKMAAGLRAAGVRRINISLDSLDRQRFRRITRVGDLDRAMGDGLVQHQATSLSFGSVGGMASGFPG